MTGSAPTKLNYRQEIDGLRAFAVVAVIINHFNAEILPSGYLGVDIFFVISGYVITASLAGHDSRGFWDFIGGFYERRIRRLLPALIAFVLVVSLLICFFNPSPDIALKTAIASLFGLSNIYLFNASTDYFAASTELNPYTHTWSLGIEEQFYFVFPFIVWFSGLSRGSVNGARNLLYTVGGLSIVSLVIFVFLYAANQSAAYFLIPARFWELAAGCLIFLALQKENRIIARVKALPPLPVLLGILLALLLPLSAAVPATIAVVGLSALLICCLRKGTWVFEFFTKKQIVYLGLISYSLYLWHWGVLSISRWTIGLHWWSVPFQIALMVILASCSYHFIETPFRSKVSSELRVMRIGAGFAAISVSALLIALCIIPLKGALFAGTPPHRPLNSNWRFDINLEGTALSGEICNTDGNYTAEQNTFAIENCCVEIDESSGSGNAKTIAFAGDSHTLSLLSAERLALERGFNVIHLSRSACPFPSLVYGSKDESCDQFMRAVESHILEKLEAGDSIVILNYHLGHLGGESLRDSRHNFKNKGGEYPTSEKEKIDIYRKSLEAFARRARSKQIDVYFVGASIRNNLLEVSSREWYRPYPQDSIFIEEYENASRVNSALAELEQGNSNLFFIDPLRVIGAEQIRNNQEFLVYFRDSDHFSEFGAIAIMGEILDRVVSGGDTGETISNRN